MKMDKKTILHLTHDVVLALIALPAGFFVRFGQLPSPEMLMAQGATRVLLFVFVIVSISFCTEIYKNYKELSTRGIAVRVSLTIMLSFVILSTFYYSAPFFMYGRGVVALSLLIFGILQLLLYIGYHFFVRFKGFAKKVLIIGTGPLAGQMGEIIPSSEENYVLSGYIGLPNEPVNVPSETILGTEGKLYETVQREKADKIVVSLSERRGVLPLREILACKLNGIEVVDAPSFYEQMTGKLLLENITPSWFIFSEGFRVSHLSRIVKRTMDLTCSVTGIILVAPFLPIIALVIKLDSPGPLFFRQVRVGRKEKNFVLFKFRTMREDAEKGTGAVWAQQNDPRITRVGTFLRKSRIDELPQLFNVFIGDMSLVGPRPERPEFVEELKKVIPYYSERHSVKPGVTGWAQIRYPYGASVADALEKLRYDLFYIKNLSLSLDIMIILETVKVVLFRRGGR